MKFILTCLLSVSLSLSAFALENEKPVAKEFTAPSLDGEIIDLNKQKGKVVVLTFWSSSCPICTSELPKLNQVVNKNTGKDVVFLALTMDNESRASAYLRKVPFSSTIIPNSLAILMDYARRDGNGNFNMSFPSYFVINQSGEIEMTVSGRNKAGAIDSSINRLLGQ